MRWKRNLMTLAVLTAVAAAMVLAVLILEGGSREDGTAASAASGKLYSRAVPLGTSMGSSSAAVHAPASRSIRQRRLCVQRGRGRQHCAPQQFERFPTLRTYCLRHSRSVISPSDMLIPPDGCEDSMTI